jgi:hypothetical protein
VAFAPLALGGAIADSALTRGPSDECPCLQSKVTIDVSSVERIILHPEEILADPDGFWRSDRAYQLVDGWHSANNQPLDKNAWGGKIEVFCGLTQEEREIHPQLVAARQVAGLDSSFGARAVAYLCDFLPPEADLTTTIYFTTEIMASGFQREGDIVVHIANHEMQNLLVHEVFHRGYTSVYRQSGNPQPETDPVRLMYLSLQNEGLATYVAYLGLSLFPNFPVNDYELFADPEESERLRRDLNQLLREARSIPVDELRPRSWETGVRQRSYYVVNDRGDG